MGREESRRRCLSSSNNTAQPLLLLTTWEESDLSCQGRCCFERTTETAADLLVWPAHSASYWETFASSGSGLPRTRDLSPELSVKSAPHSPVSLLNLRQTTTRPIGTHLLPSALRISCRSSPPDQHLHEQSLECRHQACASIGGSSEPSRHSSSPHCTQQDLSPAPLLLHPPALELLATKVIKPIINAAIAQAQRDSPPRSIKSTPSATCPPHL